MTDGEQMCPCGCAKTFRVAVRETMTRCSLNEDQAAQLIVDSCAPRPDQ